MLKPLMASITILSTFGAAFASAPSMKFACSTFIEAESYIESVPGASAELDFEATKKRLKALIAADHKAEEKLSFFDNYPLSYSEVEVAFTSPCLKLDGKCDVFDYTTTIKHTTLGTGKTVIAVFKGSLADFPEAFPEVRGEIDENTRDEDYDRIKSITLNCGKVNY